MSTQTLHFPIPVFKRQKQGIKRSFEFESGLQIALVTLVAILPAALVSIITLWAISSGAGVFVSAAYWAAGLFFLALTVENDGRLDGLLAGSGLTLMGLAWLSSSVAPEFGVLAGFLVAAWIAVPIIKKLSGDRA